MKNAIDLKKSLIQFTVHFFFELYSYNMFYNMFYKVNLHTHKESRILFSDLYTCTYMHACQSTCRLIGKFLDKLDKKKRI